jgi:DNA-binding response OmpR family regulator
MKHRVLIVDPDQPFAEMLSQGLSEAGDIEATAVTSGSKAIKATTSADYDLVIVDMGLTDIEGALLIRTLRQDHPSLSVVVIPLMGDGIPRDLADVDIQGTLPKPFFLPELPDLIRAALANGPAGAPKEEKAEEPVSKPAPKPVPDSAPKRSSTPIRVDTIQPYLARLAQETGAQAIIVSNDKKLVTHVSRLPDKEVASLATVIYESWHTSTRVAEILGKEQLRFEQSIEGGEYVLYSLALSNDVILSVVIDGSVPLGMIRHRAKETAEEIRKQL